MYNYKVGYHSYEESNYIDLFHEKLFTKEQLEDIVNKVAVEVVREMRKTTDFISNFQDIVENTLFTQMLTEKYGFKELKYQQVLSYFGWGSIFHNDDWADNKGKEEQKLVDEINKAGFTKEDDSMFRHMSLMKDEQKLKEE
jgi:hypothetical protein